MAKVTKGKMHPDREMAALLFIEMGMSQKEIAADRGVSENTISAWAREDNWNNQKKVRQLSPDKLIERIYDQIDLALSKAEESGDPLTPGQFDAMNKAASTITKLDKRLDPSIIMAVLVQFNNYLKAVDLDLAKQLLLHQKNFVQIRLNGND